MLTLNRGLINISLVTSKKLKITHDLQVAVVGRHGATGLSITTEVVVGNQGDQGHAEGRPGPGVAAKPGSPPAGTLGAAEALEHAGGVVEPGEEGHLGGGRIGEGGEVVGVVAGLDQNSKIETSVNILNGGLVGAYLDQEEEFLDNLDVE